MLHKCCIQYDAAWLTSIATALEHRVNLWVAHYAIARIMRQNCTRIYHFQTKEKLVNFQGEMALTSPRPEHVWCAKHTVKFLSTPVTLLGCIVVRRSNNYSYNSVSNGFISLDVHMQVWDINYILTCLLRSLFLNSYYCLQLRLLVHYWKLRHTWYVWNAVNADVYCVLKCSMLPSS